MCKLKKHSPMNCDVFCLADISRRHFGNIDITGNMFIQAAGVFKADNLTIGGDLVSSGTSLNLDNIKVKGSFISEDCTALFNSLSVNKTCILTPFRFHKGKKNSELINCDVFCIDGNTLPEDICITGNLYIANNDLPVCYPSIETGEDIFIESTFFEAKNIKCQGTTHVFGEERHFGFNSLISLEGSEIYSDIKENQ